MLLEHRPEREAERGQQEGRRRATAPATWAVPVMNRRRVTVSPSKAPGICRSAVYLRLGLVGGLLPCRGAEPYRPVSLRSAAGTATLSGRASSPSVRAAARRAAPASPRGRLRASQGVRRAPADRRHARLPDRLGQVGAALGARLGAQRDDVGELRDGVEVAERREPREAERVEPVAGEQREVGSSSPGQRAARRSAGGSPRGSPRRRTRPRPRAAALRGPAAATPPRAPVARRIGARGAAGRPRPARARRRHAARSAPQLADACGSAEGSAAVRAPPANAAAAASTVRSMCSGPWASDGNHASNCDGGG